ncbi:ArsR/SmtB family transcription factor [Cellulomonas iranensis]|uniref:ArsR/SmtB family transcription factor n=1 Tax=Cellulomonas iranensis TaxID=76862 RepID=UPI000B3D292E|nr:winged helix-turn-helix domain-containing protein [Cellulomonas iranensis]UCN13948.1 winged helix-turn-helix domain-containing protein [Cellulomonas iranensis]
MDDLPARVAALEERVAALEAAPTTTTTPLDTDADDRFWALTGLTARVDRPASSGAVMMVGDVRTPAGDEARWQYALTTDDLLAADWSDLAPVLAALGHPVRLALLRAVLDGARTARELADAVDVGSTGQVYHHLRQLQAAGWLRAAAGGEHVVPAERLVPLLTTLLAAVR